MRAGQVTPSSSLRWPASSFPNIRGGWGGRVVNTLFHFFPKSPRRCWQPNVEGAWAGSVVGIGVVTSLISACTQQAAGLAPVHIPCKPF